jgi:hypothetical protein
MPFQCIPAVQSYSIILLRLALILKSAKGLRVRINLIRT